jgi:hypothetical protein
MTTTMDTTLSLADQLAQAQAGAAPTRQRHAEVQAAMTRAVAESRFDDAHRLQTELASACGPHLPRCA